MTRADENTPHLKDFGAVLGLVPKTPDKTRRNAGRTVLRHFDPVADRPVAVEILDMLGLTKPDEGDADPLVEEHGPCIRVVLA